MEKTLLITGAAGFIGSALVRESLERGYGVVAVDKLTYAGNPASLAGPAADPRYAFELADICDRLAIDRILRQWRPAAILHLAAESHVDRSIDGPDDFIRTNIDGTYSLLESVRAHLAEIDPGDRDAFRFLHVSTDEVYGDLGLSDNPFTEETSYRPSSPYAASKAASDHLVRAWGRTYDLPVVVTNCSNNYGPRQFPEKLIPHMILSALAGKPLPVYGDGAQIRDWLYVGDHAAALLEVLDRGRIGETYNIGGRAERTNLEVVTAICELLECHAVRPKGDGGPHFQDLITFVADRPGHDRRYAVNTSKIESELGWTPERGFEEGLEATVEWYLRNRPWWEAVLSGDYRLNRRGL